jgi:hypothetical protein
MQTYLASDAAVATPVRERSEVAVPDTWNLDDIFPHVEAWEEAYQALDQQIVAYARRKGTLANGPAALLEALEASDTLGQLAYKVYYYCSLRYDEDTRNNEANGRRQRVQVLLAKWRQATSWFNPELLAIPRDTIRKWFDDLPALSLYRFALEELYRQQEHVLDEKGERLLSLSAQFGSSPDDTYEALSTADMKFPSVTLSTGETVEATYARYRAIVATNRNQEDRAKAFSAHHEAFHKNQNTYAALYNGVLQRDWFHSQARGYKTMLDASLHGNNIPTAVVENLIATTRAGAEPLRRYERLRRKVLGVKEYHLYDGTIPLVEFDKSYPYHDVLDWIVESVAPLGAEYQARMRRGFTERWIDVYENKGKHSGAYSASVYGVHPYMLLNYNDTLDAVFTLAHDAHDAVARDAAVRLRRLHHLRRGSALHPERSVPAALHARARRQRRRAHRPAPARDRRSDEHVLSSGAVCDLRAGSAPAGRSGAADHRGRAQRSVFRDPEGILRRRARLRRSAARDVGAHPAFLRLAVLRLSVRDLLRVERAHLPEPDAGQRRGARGGRRSLPHAAALRRQRSSDDASAAGRRRSLPARNRSGRRHAARYAGDAPGS